MGGFANLKNDFDTYFKALEPRTGAGTSRTKTPADEEKFRQDCFRFLYLRSLFEIAGNLDTIALCQRAIMEQMEKSRHQQQENFDAVKAQFAEVFEALKHPPVIKYPEFPKFTSPEDEMR